MELVAGIRLTHASDRRVPLLPSSNRGIKLAAQAFWKAVATLSCCADGGDLHLLHAEPGELDEPGLGNTTRARLSRHDIR